MKLFFAFWFFSGLCYGIIIETKIDPILKRLFALQSLIIHIYVTFHRLSRKVHLSATVSFQCFFHMLRTNAAHHLILYHTNAHLTVNHEASAAEHLLSSTLGTSTSASRIRSAS